MGVPSLGELYASHSSSDRAHSALDEVLLAALSQRLEEQRIWEASAEIQFDSEASVADWLENVDKLLTLCLLAHQYDASDKLRVALAHHHRQASLHRFWREFQLGEALLASCAELLRIDYQAPRPVQLSNGAAPLEWGGHWPTAQVPHQHHHAQLACLWALLGELTKDSLFSEAAVKAASWQQLTLDARGCPLPGLFSRESEGSPDLLLLSKALLFESVGRLQHLGEWTTLGQMQRGRLTPNIAAHIPYWMLAFEQWIAQRTQHPEHRTFSLPDVICDPQTATVGCRTAHGTVVATLTGGNTGIGSAQFGKVELRSFGPQRQSLADAAGFGIARPIKLSEAQPPEIRLHSGAHEFSLKGRVPIATVQGSHSTGYGPDRTGAWVDVSQDYQSGQLNISSQFFATRPLSQMAFTFYISADKCCVGENTLLAPRSLDKYSGPVESVRLFCEESQLLITAFSGRGQLEVIPLAGDNHFFGADFLVAYKLDPVHYEYRWQLSMPEA